MADTSSSVAAKSALRRFSLAELRKATNNFDQALIIRVGGFGELYKGTYFDYVGTEKTQLTVVLKKFFSLTACGKTGRWFKSKMEVLSQFCHKNVVSLIGYGEVYDYEASYILVYEYMLNGSLANHLCTKSTSSSFSLSWEQCLHICISAARGLEYMHASFKCSHGDVTTSNILLDDNGAAKISDLYSDPFYEKGMARFLDPEYSNYFKTDYTERRLRSDVYSFGVLLIKVLARKVSFDEEDENLGIWLQQCIMNGTINQIIHPDMKAQIPPDCLTAFVRIAGECLDTCGEKRPTMTQLVKRLEFAKLASYSQRLCRYSFLEIKQATKNFANILGEGGEGKVYGGMTKTNIPIAVKLLKPERSSEFEKEIKMLSIFDHPNLVSLIGYCHESDQKALVYEQMHNGNLQATLRADSLSWDLRLSICIGAARGLRHLHTGTQISPKGIIHRDMKPSNILLDENFNAKISDFGLSKMSLHDQAISEIPTAFKGTVGYYAPEYLRDKKITRRIDVYAFGVILTEVLCGKKPWDREHSFFPTDQNEKYSLWAKENIDPHLKGVISPSCLEAFTNILEKCLNVNPDGRPSMNDVVSVLENAQKWQESWQRNDSGLLFYLPGVEDRLVLYYTSNPKEVTNTCLDLLKFLGRFIGLILKKDSTSRLEEATGSTFEDCLRVRLFLRRFRVAIDERDPTKDLYAKEFKQVFGATKYVCLPKVFIRGKYVGGIEILNKTQELAKLLRVASPKFVCKTCGEERSCHVCNWEEWYVLCRNCDALTIVNENFQCEYRSCLECNGNQLIYERNLDKQ